MIDDLTLGLVTRDGMEIEPEFSLWSRMVNIRRLFFVWFMGFYGYENPGFTVLLNESFALMIFYWFYMLFANIFLLNVLIAVMSRTMQLESKEANLVARYRQTNLVLDEEIEQEAATRSSREGALEEAVRTVAPRSVAGGV